MPDQMTENDKDKDLTPVRPPALVTEKEETPSQAGEDVVASGEEQGELSPREMIYKNHDELHRSSEEASGTIQGYSEEEPNEVLAEGDAELDPPPEALAEGERPPEPQRKKPGPKAQVEVTVNGVTRKVDKTKVDAEGGVEAYQMMVAGQEKLRAIAQRQKNLDDGEADLKRRQEEFENRNLAAPAEDPNQAPELATPVEVQQSKLRLEANEALLDGDVDESARLNALADQALVDAATSNAVQHMETTQQQKDDASRAEAQQRADAQRKAAIEEGTASFAIEFPEIMADTQLLRLADDETVAIATQNPTWTPAQVMQQAGKNVTKWQQDQRQAGAPTSQQSKALEKRSMGTPQAGSQRSPRKPEPKQQTKGDYVAELQRKRGQMAS